MQVRHHLRNFSKMIKTASIIFTLILSYSSCAFAQEKYPVEYPMKYPIRKDDTIHADSLFMLLFKTYIYLDGHVTNNDIIKNANDFKSQQFSIDIRHIPVFFDGKSMDEYIVLLGKNVVVNNFAREQSCDYVIAYNKTTNESFRLSGFSQNDIMFFISDILQCKGKTATDDLAIDRISIEGIDLRCIYDYYSKYCHECEILPEKRFGTCLRRAFDKPVENIVIY